MESTILRIYSALPDSIQNIFPRKIKKHLKYGLVGEKYRRDYENHYNSAIRRIYDSDLLSSPTIRVLDIGARYGPQSRLHILDELEQIRLTGIEPDEEEIQRLRRAHPDEKFLAKALSKSDSERKLHLTNHRGWSSLYKPNEELLNRFDFYTQEYKVEKTVSVTTTTLDALSTELTEKYDLIKIDTQGSDGDIIAGGTETIADSLALEFETHFKPLYKEQPLFYETHGALAEMGLTLVDISTKEHYPRWAKQGKTKAPNPDGEIIEQHPVYFNFELENQEEEATKLLIISLLYRKKSIANHILDEYLTELSDDARVYLHDILEDIPSPVYATE